MSNNDRWESLPIICKGGLDLQTDALTLGTNTPGAAKILQNYEPALEGGYKRILGFSKWDSATVPGDSNTPVLGVKAALGAVYAVRYTTTGTDYAWYKSTGSGWGSPINSSARTGTVTKARMISYSITTPVVVLTDGGNPAAKYDGTNYTLLNGMSAPTAPKYAAMHLARLVLAPASTSSSIILSAPNDDTVYSGSGAIEINVGDVVVGLKSFRDTLYIFCQNSIFKLTGSSSTDFAIVSVTRSIGCVSGDTIQELGGDLYFLAPDGIRSIAATERIGDVELAVQSQAIQPLIRELVGVFSQSAYSSCVIRAKSQYRMFVYESDAPRADAFGILGKRDAESSFEWSTLRGIQAYCADSEYNDDDEVAVIGDATNGYVYRLERGNDFDGTAVYSVYRSPSITFSDATLRKVMHKIDLYTQVAGNVSFDLNVLFDFEGTGIYQPPSIPITQTGTVALYGIAVYGTDAYSGLTYPVFKKNLVGSGFTVAFQYSATNSNPPHRIDSYQITFARKGRR